MSEFNPHLGDKLLIGIEAATEECRGCEHDGKEFAGQCTWYDDTGKVGWTRWSVVRPPCIPRGQVD